jgi:signal transduction histidine kinase
LFVADCRTGVSYSGDCRAVVGQADYSCVLGIAAAGVPGEIGMATKRPIRLLRDAGRVVALGLVIGFVAAAEILRSYGQATGTAERSVAGLVRLVAEQTERTIQAIDLTLIGIRDALQVAPGLPSHDPAFKAALQERLKGLPYVLTLCVIGPNGFVVHDSSEPVAEPASFADRPYFQVHRDDPRTGLHIGPPLRSRRFDTWFVSVSRRIAKPDGSFGGVILAAVAPGYFRQFYEDLEIGDGNLISLLLSDGTMLARMPDHDEVIGLSYAESPIPKLAEVHGSGVTWNVSPVDRTNRIVAYRTLAGGALIAMVGWSEDTVYEAWLEHAAVVGGSASLVWMLASGLTLMVVRSRRRHLREHAHLAQTRRLEMMGRIAGGIAHDLGNTIKIARTTFTLLRPSLATRQDAMALVDEADRSLKSAFDIIDRLLAFARRQELSPRATDLGALVSGFAPILRQAAGPQVQVDLDLDAGRPLVCVIDPIHLESALLNLVLNGKDAMPDGGRIVIAVREAHAPRKGPFQRRQQSASPRWAEVAVRDTGSGMSREVLERAFEPFFTTRTAGSGLGLSQVLGFVQQSAGDVRIDSREGGGTAVSMLFPTSADLPSLPGQPVPPPATGPG